MRSLILGLGLALLASAPLAAQQMMQTSIAAIHAEAAQRGPASIIEPSPDYPDHYIDAQADGYYYILIPIACQGMYTCEQVEFSASFTVDSIEYEVLNAWNAGNRIGTAYAEDGAFDEVILSYTILVDPGVTITNFRQVMTYWIDAMDQFSGELYGPVDGGGGLK